MYVCVCSVLGGNKHFHTKKRIVTVGEKNIVRKQNYIIACLTGLQVNVSDLIDGL